MVLHSFWDMDIISTVKTKFIVEFWSGMVLLTSYERTQNSTINLVLNIESKQDVHSLI